MIVTFIIIKDNTSSLDSTVNSIRCQTSGDWHILIEDESEVLKNKEVFFEKITGEYCLFLRAGDYLSHDRVLEEIILNGLNEDVIYGNAIIINEDNKEDYYLLHAGLKVSSVINDSFFYQCVLVKKELLIRYWLSNDLIEIGFWLTLINILFINKTSFKHIQLFIAKVKKNDRERQKENEVKKDKYFKEFYPLIYQDYKDLFKYNTQNILEEQLLLSKIAKTAIFKYLIQIRQLLLKYGFYRLKANIKQKMYYNRLRKQDGQKKEQILKDIYKLKNGLLKRNNDKTDIIVSLTSYGKRVKEAAPYAIYSIFQQSILPNRIVLFLDYSWNDDNIPNVLKKLKELGLEIYYCSDIRSYKKLIPALRLFPNNMIVTIDDDVLYNKNLIHGLLKKYSKSDKRSVICYEAYITSKIQNKFILYSKWHEGKYGNEFTSYSPIGVGGVLYPPCIFDDEIHKEEIFMKYLPTADDIWFWFNEFRCKINIIHIKADDNYSNEYINNIDNYVEKGSTALYFENVFYGKNDVAFKKMLDYYKIDYCND